MNDRLAVFHDLLEEHGMLDVYEALIAKPVLHELFVYVSFRSEGLGHRSVTKIYRGPGNCSVEDKYWEWVRMRIGSEPKGLARRQRYEELRLLLNIEEFYVWIKDQGFELMKTIKSGISI